MPLSECMHYRTFVNYYEYWEKEERNRDRVYCMYGV